MRRVTAFAKLIGSADAARMVPCHAPQAVRRRAASALLPAHRLRPRYNGYSFCERYAPGQLLSAALRLAGWGELAVRGRDSASSVQAWGTGAESRAASFNGK